MVPLYYYSGGLKENIAAAKSPPSAVWRSRLACGYKASAAPRHSFENQRSHIFTVWITRTLEIVQFSKHIRKEAAGQSSRIYQVIVAAASEEEEPPEHPAQILMNQLQRKNGRCKG
ncbi:hypothetical protein EYF80_028384 [Liparis tanakae]|uniref:Uncharacterized protein n=1 Tax=Liparis tanakae TaxID=230148 RepID=A0A4Z2H658_9TELE|nr:hypothetical protein EYF80_028384 [Liparis tanakae]